MNGTQGVYCLLKVNVAIVTNPWIPKNPLELLLKVTIKCEFILRLCDISKWIHTVKPAG